MSSFARPTPNISCLEPSQTDNEPTSTAPVLEHGVDVSMQGINESDRGEANLAAFLFDAINSEVEYGVYHALGNMNGRQVPSGKAGGVGGCSKEAKALLLEQLSDGV